MRKIFFGLLFIALVFQFGCKEKSVTYEDSGSSIYLKVGQTLSVELPGNPSTGNAWREIVFDDQLIKKEEAPVYKPKDDRIGSAGVYYFKFKAAEPGTTRLFMEYGSKYDNAKEALKIFEIELVVAKK
jgi:inhibitor of cysteine peptidase